MSTLLNAEAPQREFHYNGIRIPDAGPELTVEQVRDLLPITQRGPRHWYSPRSDKLVLRYTFSRAIGMKG